MNYCIKNANKQDLKNMCNLWNEVVKEEYFLKPFTTTDYENYLLSNPDFSFDSTFVIYDNQTLIAFAIGYLRKRFMCDIIFV